MRLYVACLTALLSVAAAPAGADIRILLYDDDGRVSEVARHNLPAASGGVQQSVPEDPAPGFEPGEILIANPAADLRRRLAGLGYAEIETVGLPALSMDLLRLRVPEGLGVPEAIAQVRRTAPDTLVDANHLFEAAGGETERPSQTDSWVRAVIGWPPAPADCGAGVRLGIIDSAVDPSHPALVGQRIEYRNYLDPGHKPPTAEHGTAVAAILIGRPTAEGWGGILPGAVLKAANMFERNAAGHLLGNVLALLRSLDWMVAEHVHVVNLSMAGSDNRALRFALERARRKGLVFVAAAGNWGSAERPAYPAAYDEVIAVTAFGKGGRIYPMANRGAYIDFAAPGVKLWTAVPEGGRFQSGTSFAAPYISAHIADEAAAGEANDSEGLRELLRRRAIDMGPPGRDDVFGWGFVDGPPNCTP